MENKQIIIDGVNVSGCEWYSSTYFKPCNSCKGKPTCYYKQLQREKQNLQEAIDTSIREFNRAEELKTLLKRKEQEYNKLKQILTDIEFWVREFLKRTGQVVPNEIRQILQKISESEAENAR